MLPVVILPKLLQDYATLPYKTYGGNIALKESQILQTQSARNHKHILYFIGGFLDTYYKVLFHVFEICVNTHHICAIKLPTHTLKQNDFMDSDNVIYQDFCFMYSSFNCLRFLRDFIPNVIRDGYSVSVVAHSWGAKNILKLCLRYNFPLHTLITLDCVGYFTITHRPTRIHQWENIYITDFVGDYHRPNLAAIIGNGQQYIQHADSNIGIPPPAHHASVITMLKHSKILQIV